MASDEPSITLYHLRNSRSHRVLWMLEELGLNYNIELYDRQPSLRAPEDYQKLHKLSTSPVFKDGDLLMTESGAIMEYLMEFYPNDLKPDDLNKKDVFYDYRFYMHFAEGTMIIPTAQFITFQALTAHMPFFLKPILAKITKEIDRLLLMPTITNILELLEDKMNDSGWFMQDKLTVADIMMWYPIEAHTGMRGTLDKKKFPKLAAFMERVYDRPAYKRAIEKGGKLDLHFVSRKV